MSSVTIPRQWLIPKKRPNEWLFQWAIDLPELVKTNRASQYFRQLVTFLEHDNQMFDYHLKFRHNYRRSNQLDILVYFGNPHSTSNPVITPVCISCEPTHELSSASLLSEQQHTRAWIDARARPKLIITPTRHVERLIDLKDENGEMEAFWYDAVKLINTEYGELESYYPILQLNHGTYRNHAHLHLKISFPLEIWNQTVALHHRDKIQQIRRLIKDSNIANECFGEDFL